MSNRIMKCPSNLLIKKVTIDSWCSMCVKFQQMLALLLVVIAVCASGIASNPMPLDQQQQQQQQHPATAIRAQRCRDGCLEKFSTKTSLCQQQPECSMCWDDCSKMPPSKISKSIRETWSLHTVSMVQQDSLVLVDVAWEQLSVPSQCLVTWEVAGGGLMGNLLTESFNVQLSLWPDTKYRVQVTCKNKLSGLMSRSLPLTINTSEAVKAIDTAMAKLIPTARNQPVAAIITNIPTQAATTTVLPTTNAPHAAESGEDVDTNVVPYDEDGQRANELQSRPRTFLFDWCLRTNSDISFVEPMQRHPKTDPTEVFDRIFIILVFTVATLFILFILSNLLYAYPLPWSRRSSDKAQLLAEDLSNRNISLPPSLMIGFSKTAGVAMQEQVDACTSPEMWSRFTPKV